MVIVFDGRYGDIRFIDVSVLPSVCQLSPPFSPAQNTVPHIFVHFTRDPAAFEYPGCLAERFRRAVTGQVLKCGVDKVDHALGVGNENRISGRSNGARQIPYLFFQHPPPAHIAAEHHNVPVQSREMNVHCDRFSIPVAEMDFGVGAALRGVLAEELFYLVARLIRDELQKAFSVQLFPGIAEYFQRSWICVRYVQLMIEEQNGFGGMVDDGVINLISCRVRRFIHSNCGSAYALRIIHFIYILPPSWTKRQKVG